MNPRDSLSPELGGNGFSGLAPALGGQRAVWVPDARALRTLFKSTIGCSDHLISEADRRHAHEAGLMFAPEIVDHDLVLNELRAIAERLRPADLGAAFLASLSTRRLDWRSALGSYQVACRVEPHGFEGSWRCERCHGPTNEPQAIELTQLNGWRFKFGYGLYTAGYEREPTSSLVYAWFDLSQFMKTRPHSPTAEDLAIFRALVEALRATNLDLWEYTLERHLHRLMPASRDERVSLIQLMKATGLISAAGEARPPSWYGRARESYHTLNETALRLWFGAHCPWL